MPPHGRWSRRGASALVVVAVAAALLATPAPAGAHPFGDPQTMAIALDRDRPEVVHVRWRVGGLDDLTLLGVALGLLPRDRVLLDGGLAVAQPAVFRTAKGEPTVNATSAPADWGTAAKVTVNVTADGLPVTGIVELREGATVRGSATLSDGSAGFQLPVGLAAGSHTLTASYSAATPSSRPRAPSR